MIEPETSSLVTAARLLGNRFLAMQKESYVDLKLVESLPMPVYGFEPTGWVIFACVGSQLRVGSTEYLAVRVETGEVRRLGCLGE